MENFSILVAGTAGFGIDKSGSIISYMINRLGYSVYIYRDYPSVIRGGHTFSIVRASSERIWAHENGIDYLLALNQDAVSFHTSKLKANSIIIYDADTVKCDGLICPVKNAIGLPVGKILKEEGASEIMRNTCAIGGFAKAIGIEWNVVEQVLKKEITKDIEINLKVARRGYDSVNALASIKPLDRKPLPLVTGNEAVGLGLIKGGLKTYIAYPMTPSSPILHFLANTANEFNLKVLHPESEIAVILMALGFSYCAESVAVGTSGGGFCLMTEGLSFSGMAELPVVIVMGQRPGPSTGLPTYSSQTELHFALHAGQGEFVRFIVAPGDAEEAYFWSAVSMDMSRRFQIPSIILTDKTMGEGVYNIDVDSVDKLDIGSSELWEGKPPYKRYQITDTGVSPLAIVPDKDAVIKVNSYEHDEYGLTTEDPEITTRMQDKRLLKIKFLLEEVQRHETIKTYGNQNSSTVVLCWGSNKGVCIEAAQRLNLKVVQPVVLSPFPIEVFKKAIEGAKKIILVENSATGQLRTFLNRYGINIDAQILKYDGRPFSVDELEGKLKKTL
ncbi:MAG: 2-oxoacid:acceptor oxidoreductase subunit alpha [Candidatus Omnitrophota bacterium]|nr:2-oxoacid:acceptor oxidoreductase subunit alpha [Candidatus Omnitrophota bacterium]